MYISIRVSPSVPATQTRPSGSSTAVEWYSRGTSMGASWRQVSVSGSNSSGSITGSEL